MKEFQRRGGGEANVRFEANGSIARQVVKCRVEHSGLHFSDPELLDSRSGVGLRDTWSAPDVSRALVRRDTLVIRSARFLLHFLFGRGTGKRPAPLIEAGGTSKTWYLLTTSWRQTSDKRKPNASWNSNERNTYLTVTNDQSTYPACRAVVISSAGHRAGATPCSVCRFPCGDPYENLEQASWTCSARNKKDSCLQIILFVSKTPQSF